MDKRTIIAIVIAALLFGGYILVTSVILPAVNPPRPTVQPTEKPVVEKPVDKTPLMTVTAVPLAREINEQTAKLHGKVLDIAFSNKGGVVTSIKLNDNEKDPKNQRSDDGIEMVFAYRANGPEKARTSEEYPFELRFGDVKTPAAKDLFEMTTGENRVEFARTYAMTVLAKNDKGEEKETVKKVKVKKTFELIPEQYLLKLSVSLESEAKEPIPFDTRGVLYTLGIGPQIGPEFEDAKPDGRSDYRQFVILANSGKKEFGLPPPVEPVTDAFTWAAIAGKYYGIIASTDATIKDLVLDGHEANAPFVRSAIYFERKREITQALTDEYTFFIGPKKRDILDSYKDKKYGELSPISFPFGWIAELLKYPLDFFALVGNYGVAIILLTLLIKILLFPLTRKSFDSMKKMQAVNPKLQEIRTRYKDNPKRMNEEMAALYKSAGISPLGGCLPQLLQLPILFGLYELFNTHFALKNAVFIPGWIKDLSVAESIYKLPSGPIVIPLVNFVFSDIRLLPFIMLGTQLATTFLTAGQSSGGDSRMKYLPYIMMVVFFFVLYNMPSGLVLYWTVQNILTVVQMLIQQFFADRKKKAVAVAN
jgi:YidC/Oxa1 family membrane protein insertase